jgi:hypothetical protein
VELSVHGTAVPLTAPSTIHSANPSVGAELNAGTVCDGLPALNPGKPIPSLEEWRALERRACSFRV